VISLAILLFQFLFLINTVLRNKSYNGQIFAAITAFVRIQRRTKLVTSFLTDKPVAMKPVILLLAFSLAAFTSCTTAYRSGQTPDDVYYSAAKINPEDDEQKTKQDEQKDYSYDDQYYDDRYIRMKVHNRTQWSDLDDWYYYDRYSYRYNYYFGSYNNPYSSWNFFYNPYCCCHNNYAFNYKLPSAQPIVKRHFNLAGYTNTSYNTSNKPGTNFKIPAQRVYNNSNKSLSEKVRTILNSDNNSSTRTYQPSSSSSGNNSSSSGSNNNNSSSGKSGSSGTVTRPTRN